MSKRENLAFHTITKIESGGIQSPTIDTVQKTCPATPRSETCFCYWGSILNLSKDYY